MSGGANGERTITAPEWGSSFGNIYFYNNFSATNPTSLMGIDYDNIEVWDGMPTAGPNPPKNLRKVPTP